MAVVIWAALATLNLAAAVAIASWPSRQADLDTMRRWTSAWLVNGDNIYAVDRAWPEYPPHAIVALSPIALMPGRWLAPIWAALNLFLAGAVAYAAVRTYRKDAERTTLIVPVLMFLCWGGFRTLLQFSLLSLACGLVAFNLSKRRPGWGGVWLGLALMKPQVAIPFFLWAVFARQLKTLAVALAVVAAGVAIYAARIHANPLHVAGQYAGIVQGFYIGDSILIGLAQPRPLIELLTAHTWIVDSIAVGIALATLTVVLAIGFAEMKQTGSVSYAAPGLAAVWSLLTFYSLTYGFLILLPLAATLVFDENSSTSFRRRLFWILQLAMMFDLTVLWRWFGHLVPAPEGLGRALAHADRLLMLGLFVSVAALGARTRQGGAAAETAL